MFLIPREKPVVENLNSYYVDIAKLIEHYQGEVGAGVVHFQSPVSEAVLFFDEQSIVNGFLDHRRQHFHGTDAVERVVEGAGRNNFTISVYRILPERLYFWANLPKSKVVYADLTSEFTNLEGLIRKLEAEKFTGYIDVEVKNAQGGLLFIYKGEVIGGSSADGAGNLDRSEQYRQDLIQRSKEYGGNFNVSRVMLDEPVTAKMAAPEQARNTSKADSGSREAKIDSARVMEMLGGLLYALESVVRSNRKIRGDFETLLNRKFVEKVDKYEFLDPFAAEFRYAEGKAQFTGSADQKKLVAAVAECVTEIAENHGLLVRLQKNLEVWRREFADEISAFDIRL